MKILNKLRVGLAAAALGVLALAGCGTMLEQPMPKTHHNKIEVQHMYDTGQINYQEYCDMMKEIDPAWTPQTPTPTKGTM
jgi:hypothetical protein